MVYPLSANFSRSISQFLSECNFYFCIIRLYTVTPLTNRMRIKIKRKKTRQSFKHSQENSKKTTDYSSTISREAMFLQRWRTFLSCSRISYSSIRDTSIPPDGKQANYAQKEDSPNRHNMVKRHRTK